MTDRPQWNKIFSNRASRWMGRNRSRDRSAEASSRQEIAPRNRTVDVNVFASGMDFQTHFEIGGGGVDGRRSGKSACEEIFARMMPAFLRFSFHIIKLYLVATDGDDSVVFPCLVFLSLRRAPLHYPVLTGGG